MMSLDFVSAAIPGLGEPPWDAGLYDRPPPRPPRSPRPTSDERKEKYDVSNG